MAYQNSRKRLPLNYYHEILKLNENPLYFRLWLVHGREPTISHHHARPHVSLLTFQKLIKFGYELFPQPTDSPDLYSADYRFFKHIWWIPPAREGVENSRRCCMCVQRVFQFQNSMFLHNRNKQERNSLAKMRWLQWHLLWLIKFPHR